MRIRIEQAALHKALNRVSGVIERRNTVPILGYVLIEADGEVATLSGTDLDMMTVANVAAQVERGGIVAAPAALLSDIVRNAPAGAEIVLQLDPAEGSRLKVRFGRSTYQLGVLDADQFPRRNDPSWPSSMDLDARDLHGILARAAFAASTDETRYWLNGTYLHLIGENGVAWLRAAGADTTRVAYAQTRSPDGAPSFPGVILPRKTVAELMKLLDGRVGPVRLDMSTEAVRLNAGDVAITSKLIEGEYPDYARPIAASWSIEAEVDRLALAGAVRRVALISGEKERGVKLTLAAGVLSVSVRNLEAGQAAEDIEVDYDGEPLEVGFNARLILEALDQSGADRLLLRANGPREPVVLVPTLDDPEAGLVCSLLSPRVVAG